MYHFAASGAEGTILFQYNRFCNSGTEGPAETVGSPFRNTGYTSITMGTSDGDRYPVIVGEYPLTGHLPAALCGIVKGYGHITAGNAVCNGIQNRHVDQQTTTDIGLSLRSF